MTDHVFESRADAKRALLKPFLCWIVLLLAAQSYSQSANPEFPDPGKPGMSREDQRSLGLQTAAEVYKQMPILPDSSPETQYVQHLGQQLVSTIPSQYSWPFEFHVVAQQEINAFALPGGPMFINIGTITASANEAELAGVMAHEMAHVYMQHSAKQAGKAQTTSIIAGIASAVLGGATGGGGLIGQLGQMGIQMGAQGLMMKYSRGDESQADSVGSIILYKAGFNPQAMADFFKTLGEQGGKTPPQFFSSHPNPGNREKDIQKMISNWPAKNYAPETTEFQQVRLHARGVKAYTGQEIAQGAKSGQWAAINKENGATFRPSGAQATNASATAPSPTARSSPTPESVLPSPQMRTADLGEVKIQYPENWKVTMPTDQGRFITIAPEAGVTNGGVGYGVLMNGVLPPQGERLNIDEVTNHLVRQLQQHNGLEPRGVAQPITVGGVEGRAVILQSPSPFLTASGQPQLEKDWLVTVPQRDGTVVFMIFVAPESEFDRFQPTYERMLKSIQF